MTGNTLAVAPRQALLDELRGRPDGRGAAIQKRLQALKDEFEKLALECIKLSAELRVLEIQLQECRSTAEEKA